MAKVFYLIVLLTLTLVQSVVGNANQCKGKEYGEPCGNDEEIKACVCPNENIVAVKNAGQGSPCGGNGQLVCKVTKCYDMSGRNSKPEKRGGKVERCTQHEDCSEMYMCTNYGQYDMPYLGYCCHSATGKAAKLVTPYDGK